MRVIFQKIMEHTVAIVSALTVPRPVAVEASSMGIPMMWGGGRQKSLASTSGIYTAAVAATNEVSGVSCTGVCSGVL